MKRFEPVRNARISYPSEIGTLGATVSVPTRGPVGLGALGWADGWAHSVGDRPLPITDAMAQRQVSAAVVFVDMQSGGWRGCSCQGQGRE